MEDGSLVSIGENIWIIEGDIVSFYGFPYPTRSVVIRLQSGSVWIWSPVKLTNHVRQELAAIGPPMHLVSPNKLHHLYLENWQKAFPHARLWGPASTLKKRLDLSFEPALVDDAPSDWAGQMDQCWVRGSFTMDEIVFFHQKSRTVILADLSENFSNKWLLEHWRPWQRWLAYISGITEEKGYAPHDWRSTFLRRKVLRQAKEKVLSRNPSKVVIATWLACRREYTGVACSNVSRSASNSRPDLTFMSCFGTYHRDRIFLSSDRRLEISDWLTQLQGPATRQDSTAGRPRSRR